jgi:hypothetical protein
MLIRKHSYICLVLTRPFIHAIPSTRANDLLLREHDFNTEYDNISTAIDGAGAKFDVLKEENQKLRNLHPSKHTQLERYVAAHQDVQSQLQRREDEYQAARR